ncbi:hypothetical protein CH063_08440 [Colletotrichum higginsianum]|uniref:Uncharacterized protein n=1 Tax=Colletotrichum higginsianum (strain IMI 349063) TaxID=759273 RepID=H1V9V3_COLHI|nr:hypothetical protein CH063_08440 [Colletotrichum higginsianum]
MHAMRVGNTDTDAHNRPPSNIALLWVRCERCKVGHVYHPPTPFSQYLANIYYVCWGGCVLHAFFASGCPAPSSSCVVCNRAGAGHAVEGQVHKSALSEHEACKAEKRRAALGFRRCHFLFCTCLARTTHLTIPPHLACCCCYCCCCRKLETGPMPRPGRTGISANTSMRV